MLDACLKADESLGGFLQRLEFFAEGESRDGSTELRLRVETHPRHRRDANLLRQPQSKLARFEIRDLREVGKYIVGPFRCGVLEPGFIERRAHDLAPRTVLESEMVVVVRVERHPNRASSLQRSRSAHGQKIVHLAYG